MNTLYHFLCRTIIHQGWGTSKSGVALKILGVAPKVGEKGVALGRWLCESSWLGGKAN